MCGLCSRPHSLVSPVLYVSATPRYPTSEWGSFCSSSPGARRTPAWHSLENVLRGGTRAAGTLNGLIVILFGQPRFSTWRRARAPRARPCALRRRALDGQRGARAYDLHSADTKCPQNRQATGTDGRGGPRAISTIPTYAPVRRNKTALLAGTRRHRFCQQTNESSPADRHKTYEVYTCPKQGAFGLVQVVSAGDKEASAKQKRESASPHERVRLDIQLQPAQASVKADRKAILNAIVGADADVEPPDEL